jgi:hypothetical protein
MQKWEYIVVLVEFGVSYDPDKVYGIDCLNRLGQNGWELVGTIGDGSQASYAKCIFKRPLK